jgi:hypothetical protein
MIEDLLRRYKFDGWPRNRRLSRFAFVPAALCLLLFKRQLPVMRHNLDAVARLEFPEE